MNNTNLIGGVAGLNNIANNCYLNSVLQALLHTPEFLNIFSEDAEHRDICKELFATINKSGSSITSDCHSGCILCAMLLTFIDMQRSENSVTPWRMIMRMKQVCKRFVIGNQEDAHEFFIGILSAIRESFGNRNYYSNNVYGPNSTPIDALFGCTKKTRLICRNCSYESTTYNFESPLQLTLNIGVSASVSEALQEFFNGEWIHEYNCANCQTMSSAIKTMQISTSPPPVICIHLLRFDCMGQKILRVVKANTMLDLNSYCTTNNPHVYKLSSVVSHFGASIQSGHYKAFCRDNEDFCEYDDSNVRKVELAEIEKSHSYLLFYRRQDPAATVPTNPSFYYPPLPLIHKKNNREMTKKMNHQTVPPPLVINKVQARTPAKSDRQQTDKTIKRICLIKNGEKWEIANRTKATRKPVENTVPPLRLIKIDDQWKIKSSSNRDNWNKKWILANRIFERKFTNNSFGFSCGVCDRLWFRNDVKQITEREAVFLAGWINENTCNEDENFDGYFLCSTCQASIKDGKMPKMAKWNGFTFPAIPRHLPPLDMITERLISPRLPFMQIRRLRQDLSYGITGQVINVPVDVPDMVYCLPRRLNEDDVINVNLMRNLLHKSTYLSGCTSKQIVGEWLDVLQQSTLFKELGITIDMSRLNSVSGINTNDHIIDSIDFEKDNESELLLAMQHTMIWNENCCLNIAPAQHKVPLNIIHDKYAEELSFPGKLI